MSVTRPALHSAANTPKCSAWRTITSLRCRPLLNITNQFRRKTMTITKRLILTLSVALIALLFVGAYGLLQLHRSQVRFDSIQTRIIPSIHGLNNAKGVLADTRLA